MPTSSQNGPRTSPEPPISFRTPGWSRGRVSVLGRRLYYRSFGVPRRGTVLTLHGGPGATHDYLLPLADLSASGYRVVFYDQLGCGRSEVPGSKVLFTVERYTEEVDAIRRALGLGRVHLIGSSWGGLLALSVARSYPSALRSLVTIGGLADVPFAEGEMGRLRRRLPAWAQRALAHFDASGRSDDPAYVRACDLFYHRHLCRLDPWPAELTHSLQLTARRPVYPTMNGPNEFTITGTIRYWDMSRDLAKIRVPTLVTGGRFDEVTPAVARQIHRGIPGSESVTFARSSHTPFWEERERFMRVVGDFLARHS
jgi:proline iminopeptidase